MYKYKIQIKKTYCIDILSKTLPTNDDESLRMEADRILSEKMRNGIDHYNETESPDYMIFDVTNTDDPFDAEVTI